MKKHNLSLNSPSFGANNCDRKKINALSIRHQIYWGYTVTMAIAILGTSSGLLIAHQYQKQAYDGLMLADRKEKLLSNLQDARLEIPFYRQQLLITRQNYNSEEFEKEKSLWVAEIRRFQQNILQLDSAYDILPELTPILSQYKGAIDAYALELEILSQEIDSLGTTPKDRDTAQELIGNFLETPAVKNFNDLCNQLLTIIPKVYEQKNLSAQEFKQATKVRQQIIVSSLLVSVLLSTGLAIYTSRAIARPLEEVTQFAQRVTNESNFNLQIPHHQR
jgi:two-component system NtrC family sensor kinase